MKGEVIEAITSFDGGNPHHFRIKGEDDNIYFAHLGDIKNNEDKLYNKTKETIYLYEGDIVEFDPRDPERRAIHIIKLE